MTMSDAILGLAGLFFLWAQNQGFRRQNDIFAISSGSEPLMHAKEVPDSKWIIHRWPLLAMLVLVSAQWVWFWMKNHNQNKEQSIDSSAAPWVLGVGITVMAAHTLWTNWADKKAIMAMHFAKKTESQSTSVVTYTIGFDYLPQSPLENEWTRAYKQDAIFESGTDPEMPGSLRLKVKGSELAIDRAVPPYARLSDRLCFTARTSTSTMIFTQLEVTTKDGKERKPVWIKFYPDRAARAIRTPGDWHDPSKQIPEQTVWLPFKTLENGIMRYDIDLHKAVELALGSEGWIYNAISTIRLRGDLSISPIVFSAEQR